MSQPELRLPALLARIGPKLPQKPWSQALALSLNAASKLGKLPEDIHFMTGRSISVCIRDLGATATVLLQKNGRFVAASGGADVRFSANLGDLVSIIRRQEDPDTLFFQRRLLIEGDTELGLTLKNLLDSIELPAWLTVRS
jgi:O2-independent ubiquinone biosynthesis accessory factor UbiT